MTIAEAFLACARSALDHLAANEALTLGGWPGGIHQSRVAIRRQRAVLRAFKRALPYDSRKAFNYEFRWFQKKMEPARDWHVFLDETLPFMAADGIDKESLDKLRRLAVVERRRESRVAAEYLTSRRFARLILHFERWLELLPAEDPLGKLQRALRPFATKVLERTHRDLTTIDTRPLVHMSSTDLHALRIRGKKARYAGELFRALYPEVVTARQLALLASFQDRLGRANDAATARQIVATIKASRIPARDVALLSDWAEEQIRSCTVAAQPHWRKLQRMEPFWR
jgi:CHAD domain-containing protein